MEAEIIEDCLRIIYKKQLRSLLIDTADKNILEAIELAIKKGSLSKEKEMLDTFIQNINKRILEIERVSCNDFPSKSSVLYELKDLKKTYEERLQKLKGAENNVL